MGYLLSMGVHQVAIVNYESLRKFFVWDIRGGKQFRLKDVVFNPQIQAFKSIIIDESHRVKDPSAQQTIFTKGLSVGKDWCILLSGTPVVNRPEDLIAQLSIMNRLGEFGGRAKFIADYCTDPKDKTAEPAVPLSELSRQLYNTCMIRREKAKVLPQLPDKTRWIYILRFQTTRNIILQPKTLPLTCRNTQSVQIGKYAVKCAWRLLSGL